MAAVHVHINIFMLLISFLTMFNTLEVCCCCWTSAPLPSQCCLSHLDTEKSAQLLTCVKNQSFWHFFGLQLSVVFLTEFLSCNWIGSIHVTCPKFETGFNIGLLRLWILEKVCIIESKSMMYSLYSIVRFWIECSDNFKLSQIGII